MRWASLAVGLAGAVRPSNSTIAELLETPAKIFDSEAAARGAARISRPVRICGSRRASARAELEVRHPLPAVWQPDARLEHDAELLAVAGREPGALEPDAHRLAVAHVTAL